MALKRRGSPQLSGLAAETISSSRDVPYPLGQLETAASRVASSRPSTPLERDERELPLGLAVIRSMPGHTPISSKSNDKHIRDGWNIGAETGQIATDPPLFLSFHPIEVPALIGEEMSEFRSELAVQGQVCENGRSESSQICFWYPKTTPPNRLRCGSPGYLANVSPLDARKGLAPSKTIVLCRLPVSEIGQST